MEYKVNYIQAINFINLFNIQLVQGNPKSKAKSRKMGL